jgi:hypothetical protein
VWIAGQLVARLANPSYSSPFGIARVAILAASAAANLLHLVALVCILIDVDFDSSFVDFFQLLYVRNLFLALAMLFCFVLILDFLAFHHLFGTQHSTIGGYSIIDRALVLCDW